MTNEEKIMGIKTALRKVWTWRREREARHLRERIFRQTAGRGWTLRKMKAAEDFILAAPKKERALRETLLMRYNGGEGYNTDGLNPKDPVTGLRTQKALLVEGYILRSKLAPELLRPSGLPEDSQDTQEAETSSEYSGLSEGDPEGNKLKQKLN